MMLPIMTILAGLAATAAEPPAMLDIEVRGLRSSRGQIHLCMTRERAHFPDCTRDPSGLRRTVSATVARLRFANVPAGSYAVTLVHDENSNKRLDKLLGIPREGFGFSRNPVVRFGAPKFEDVRIQVGPGVARALMRVQYLL